jgi:hypothetical protein
MDRKKKLWIKLSLINLALVAFFGLTLRSKILFSIPFIDYRSFLSAHSHFAFSGWVGMALLTLLIYNLLPPALAAKKLYQWLLAGVEISALGMAFSFPLQGYGTVSIFFSSLYIVTNYIFAPVFISDIIKSKVPKTVRILSVSAIISLLLSAIGPLGLVYILMSKSGNSIMYRDSIYTFLHFQYNGFFTLSVFALFIQSILRRPRIISGTLKRFTWTLTASVLPGVFLSLLWHSNSLFYIVAVFGALLLLTSLFLLVKALVFENSRMYLFTHPLAKTLGTLSFISFGLKLLLNAGTIIPDLGNAVYGDRPVIIGFLHLVFLAFISFYILSTLLEEGFFSRVLSQIKLPFYVFITGVLLNEMVLMLQGLGILLKLNSHIFNWLLWIAAIILFIGATRIAAVPDKQKGRHAA